MTLRPRHVSALLVLLLPLLARAEVPAHPRFNADIRPILSGRCFFCHGPDEKHREGHLRLDVRDGALAEHDGVKAIVPGHAGESELLERVVSHDPDEQMPPPKSKRPPLAEEEVATLRRWIEQGAEYEGHWAFLPLRDEPPPVATGNPIDGFIRARLAKEGLEPSPEADRPTLIRRVSLDLTGLLPTPEEVDAFAADSAPDAYERLVDRLLASPHFGERWGRHWLDQARYADSNGYAVDNERAMWPYRDWVIKAVNDDLPFDQFTIEQLAGDLLPHPTKSQLIATAFHRNTLINEEGGSKPEQFRVEAALDRTNTTGAVWLGLTVGCAQCHSHKFDPIPHDEYYRLFAFFNSGTDVNNQGATLDVARGEVFGTGPTAEERKASAAKAARPQPTTEWETAERARLAEAPAPAAPVSWSPAQYVEYDTATNGGFQLLEDNSLLSDGRGSFNDTYRVLARTTLPRVAAVRLRVLTHDSLPHRGPGMAANGNFVLTEFTATASGAEQPFERALADHEQPGYPAAAAIDGQPKTGWAINVAKGETAQMNAPHEIVFVFAKPVEASAGALEFRLRHELNEKYLIGRFALEFSETAPAVIEAPLLQALKVAPEARTAEQRELVGKAYAAAHPAPAAPKAKERGANADLVSLMVMKELPEPRPTFIFLRGDFLRPDEKRGPLQPGVLSAVSAAYHQAPGPMANRLDLARWLVDPENPLTPRVTMNRVWMRYFGRGLVETDDDFGSQGAAPTHPELLDWLGREFLRQKWGLKAMHRLIVTSATYRQASRVTPEAAEKDSRNLLLGRQSRVRVEAEVIRDAALSASGLLNPAIGGPSVYPPQPEGVYAFTQRSKSWNTSIGPDRYRRALYTMFFRSAPHPLFSTFDAPDFQGVCTRRGRSDTPLQALALANDEAFFEMAQGLAARAIREAGPDRDAQIGRAFRLCLCRAPSEKELGLLRGWYDAQGQRGEADPLVSVARTLLNTDSFITRE